MKKDMNEVGEIIKEFIDEKVQIKKQIKQIEEKRMEIAEQRNKLKNKENKAEEEKEQIRKIGAQITELGKKSQEMQNRLNIRHIETKRKVNEKIQNIVSKTVTEIIATEQTEEIVCEKEEKQEIEISGLQLLKEIEIEPIIKSPKIGKVEFMVKEEIQEIDINEKEETKDIEQVIESYIKQIKEKSKETILAITVKIEEKKVIYEAQISNGETIKIQYKENKEKEKEIKEKLIRYAISENKILDKSVIKKADMTICKIIEEYAGKYKQKAEKLIYEYIMTYSTKTLKKEEKVPQIVYNLLYEKESQISKKEKNAIEKQCKNARKNEKIEIIGYSTKIEQIRKAIRKIINTNKNALPEGKCTKL